MQKINIDYVENFPWPKSTRANNFQILSFQEMGFYSIWASDTLVGIDLGNAKTQYAQITGNAIIGRGPPIKIDLTKEGMEELREAWGLK